MLLSKILKENITQNEILEQIAKHIKTARFLSVYISDIQVYINVIGDNFDLVYIKTPNQFKVKKNNRPIIYLTQYKNELLRRYKFLSPNELLSLIGKMVIIGKSDKLVRDETYLKNWLNFNIDSISLYDFHNLDDTTDMYCISNIELKNLKKGFIPKDTIKKIYTNLMQDIWKTYYIKGMLKKYNLKTQKAITKFLEGDINVPDNQKFSFQKDHRNVLEFLKRNSLDNNFLTDVLKGRRTDVEMLWYFKVRRQYEPDSTNMTQLFEDEYQKKLEGLGIARDDKYITHHNIRKFLSDKDLFEYLAIMKNHEN